jgi:hypothetical protein
MEWNTGDRLQTSPNFAMIALQAPSSGDRQAA